MMEGLDVCLGFYVVVAFVASAILAQLAEHVTCNLGVPGSIPGDGSRVL